MPWVYLFLAGLCETGWAVALKQSQGLTRPGWVAATAVLMAASLALLGLALRWLPLGTAYAVWTGIGAVGAAAAGAALLGEPLGAARLISIGLIVAGIVGLKLST